MTARSNVRSADRREYLGDGAQVVVWLTPYDHQLFTRVRGRLGYNQSRAVRDALTSWTAQVLQPGPPPTVERPVYPWDRASKKMCVRIPFDPTGDRLLLAQGVLGITQRDATTLAVVAWLARLSEGF